MEAPNIGPNLMEKSDTPVLQPTIYRRRVPISSRSWRLLTLYQRVPLTSVIFVLALLYIWHYDGHLLEPLLLRTQEEPEFHHLAAHCDSLEPIQPSEYHARQSALASALHSLRAAAYIAEPGPNAEYFANLSLSQWGLSERPFLLIISPLESSTSAQIVPQVTIITPLFESSRAKLLAIPTAGNVRFVPWGDDADPYAVAISSLRDSVDMAKDEVSLFIDENSRYFIADGIKNAADGIRTEITPPEIRALREQKSPTEVALLRCVNEVTLLALRDVQKRMYLGMRESEAKDLILKALADAGLRHPQGLVLFGENAALPHGGGNDRELGEGDLALFDIMGSLHGYWSDLTRTVAIKGSKIPSDNLETWYLVSAAQAAALRNVRRGIKASEVDEAARDVLRSAGVGNYFTHRLGHGIGLQLHESPYLRGGNDVVLSPGNVFSNEPGIYIEGKVGIRLEDCFMVDDAGLPDLLTGGVGGQAYSPWQP